MVINVIQYKSVTEMIVTVPVTTPRTEKIWAM